jgi:hypothetical protein
MNKWKVLFGLLLTACVCNGQEVSGCNFGVTNTVVVGSSYSYTIGQGPWGVRKYTWIWGDGSANTITYSTPTNSTFASHTYTANGAYTWTVNACDSATGAGCLSYGVFTLNIVDSTETGIAENKKLEKDIFICPTPFNEEINIAAGFRFDEIIIYDVTGKKISAQKFFRSDHFILETSSVLPGCYFIEVYSGGILKSRRTAIKFG